MTLRMCCTRHMREDEKTEGRPANVDDAIAWLRRNEGPAVRLVCDEIERLRTRRPWEHPPETRSEALRTRCSHPDCKAVTGEIHGALCPTRAGIVVPREVVP